MKLVVKKIYCLNCRRLVKGHVQRTDTNILIQCPKCGLLIWARDSFNWKYVAKNP